MMSPISMITAMPEALACETVAPADAGFAALLAQVTPVAILPAVPPVAATPPELVPDLPAEPDPTEPDDPSAVDNSTPGDQDVEAPLLPMTEATPLVAAPPLSVPPAPSPAAAKVAVAGPPPEIVATGKRPVAVSRTDDLPDKTAARQRPPVTDENRALFAATRPPVVTRAPAVVSDAPSPVPAAVAATPAPGPGIVVPLDPVSPPALAPSPAPTPIEAVVPAVVPVIPAAPSAMKIARERPVVSTMPAPAFPGRVRRLDGPPDAQPLPVVGASALQPLPSAPAPTPGVPASIAPSGSTQDAAPRLDTAPPPADPAGPSTARIDDSAGGFDLSTDRLGSVRVALEARDTRIGVQFVVETPASAALLGSQAPRLADAVASAGGRLDALSVDVRGSGTSAGGGRDAPTPQQRPRLAPARHAAAQTRVDRFA